MLEKKFRVLEIFGPTIQGEGRHIGIPCYFIRFGGCDYRCSWCDSPHAVLPELVAKAPQMTVDDIVQELYSRLRHGPRWVVFSGGNPALLQLDDLVSALHYLGYKIMVETQGTVVHPWLGKVNEVCFSPKPPSSGNVTSAEILAKSLAQYWVHLPPLVQASGPAYLKIPIFDYHDYIYARTIHRTFPEFEMFLSVGNSDPMLPTVGNNAQGDPNFPVDKAELLRHMRWLMEEVAEDPGMQDVRVTPQLHVLAWGNERGR